MTVLMTGFPGFLGGALLPRVLETTDEDAVCVVQPKYAALAEQRVARLADERPTLSGRIALAPGDITRPGMGLADLETLTAGVTGLWHLAAAYDLAVPRDLGLRVNVDGTRHALDVAARCPRLERFHHVSTCYVSGRHPGPFAEDDLEVGAPFNNAYEETKHLAEALVRERMAAGLPATVYRPSIVLGDSRTGQTQKLDGLYFVIQLLLRQPRVAVLPVFGDPTAFRANVVPSDFVVEALAHLSGLPQSRGRTYQLADPHPLTVDEWYDALAAATDRRIVRVPLPERLTRSAVDRVPGLSRLLGLPAELLDYFVHPTDYLSAHTQADLAGSGIACPPFSSYASRIVDFVRHHRDVPSRAMV
ncbi:SDR family oxidoreductase [Nocardioides sp. MAHUQ-72]|uniref:SDR family oxidoreductase n=1 Tax=unclassified Nocardioides TaxID=2615069 RepID=UPI00361D83E2